MANFTVSLGLRMKWWVTPLLSMTKLGVYVLPKPVTRRFVEAVVEWVSERGLIIEISSAE